MKDPLDIRNENRRGGMTITPEWKLPLYVVVPIIGLAIVITRGYLEITNKLNEVVSRSEMREYVQVLRQKNPTLIVPDFPINQNAPVGIKSSTELATTQKPTNERRN